MLDWRNHSCKNYPVHPGNLARLDDEETNPSLVRPVPGDPGLAHDVQAGIRAWFGRCLRITIEVFRYVLRKSSAGTGDEHGIDGRVFVRALVRVVYGSVLCPREVASRQSLVVSKARTFSGNSQPKSRLAHVASEACVAHYRALTTDYFGEVPAFCRLASLESPEYIRKKVYHLSRLRGNVGMPGSRVVFLFVLCLLLWPCVNPVCGKAFHPDIRYKHLSLDEGLSQSTVFASLHDRQGYMWFGTEDGLNRYDGYQFTVYRRRDQDSLSLPDNYVTSLLEDSKGQIWIGTYSGGVAVLDKSTGAFTRIALPEWGTRGIRTNPVMSLAKDVNGDIWVAVWSSGVSRFNARSGGWTHFGRSISSGSPVDNRVRYVYADRYGFVWACTFGGLDRFDPEAGEFVHFSQDSIIGPGLRDRRFMCAFEDHEGDLWFGTFEGGLVLYRKQAKAFTRIFTTGTGSFALSSNRISAIGETDDGLIWVGTWDAGVNLVDKRSGQVVVVRQSGGEPQSLSTDAVRSVYKDKTGGIWVGTSGGGVNHFDPDRFKFRHLKKVENNRQSLANANVRSLLEDRNGVLWIGTTGGLDSYNLQSREFKHFRHDPTQKSSISADIVTALLEDRDGRLWIGTDGGGLNLLNSASNTFRVFRNVPGDSTTIGFDYIIALHEGRDGSIWIGTSGGGLTRMDRRSFKCTRFQRRGNSPNQISGNYVYAIHEGDSGELWLGTWGAGVTVLDPGTRSVRVYQHDPASKTSLNNNTVLDIFRDRRGNLWFGTLGGGVDRYDHASDRFIHTTESEGLPNSTVYGILEDSSGNLWISTNRGITCYDVPGQQFRHYGVSEGLQSFEFSQNAFCKGAQGRLYFGGINGVNIIETEHIKISWNVPPVVITQMKLMDREVLVPGSPEQTLELAPDENFLSFMFSALDYTAPEQNTYRYMLEGLDRTWVEAGTRHYAAYTDLQPGEYVFHVQGSNVEGIWNAQGASLQIRVTPPYWKTLWFRAMALACIVGMAFGFYRDRIRRLKKERAAQAEFSRKLNESQEDERKRIAGELHDSLGQNLLTIKSRLVRCSDISSPPVLQQHIGEVTTAVQNAIEEVREISADLHPHMLERLGLRRTIESTVKKCAASSGISIEASIDDMDGWLLPREEINVFRIVQEGLNNVVKHSKASECGVIVQKKGGECEMTITDDGCGFIPSGVSGVVDSQSGFGLVHMAERVRLLHGSMGINSSPGNGTTLHILLPFARYRAVNDP
jgi:signal transduction histidine kinase/ligand-binding sensor domain-containing protein